MTGSSRWPTAIARAANAIFFVVTATYCILTYSSFAYQQFIRPRLVASLVGFVVFHHLWHWLFLAVTVATLLPEWKTSRGRMVAWSYAGAMAVAGLVMLWRPVLPSVENDSLGLWLASAFLVPPIWLAIYDHLATSDRMCPAPVDTSRLMLGAAATGIVIWALHAATSPLRREALGDYTTNASWTAFGIVISLVVHVGVCTVAGVLLAGMLAAIRRRTSGGKAGNAQYWLIVAVAFGLSLLTMKWLVFQSLSFGGAAAWLLAAECAAALTLTWSAAARRLSTGIAPAPTALERWLLPVPGTRSPLAAVPALASVAVIEVLLLRRIERFDWNFLVQNLVVLVGWALTASLVHAMLRRLKAGAGAKPFAVAALAVVAVAGVGAGGTIEAALPGSSQFVPEFVLDGYATVDPSYRLMRQMLSTEPASEREFFDYLGANTLIEHVDVKPIDIDFATKLGPAPSRPPHIFLFVIDSLRRDYLSPYNPTVVTPSFDAFAREGFTFQRSFTRYGGTGLSMPAIWAGSMLIHKQYVQPFDRMNALEKLLAANRYTSVMGMDHITAQLVSRSTLPVQELDEGRNELQYDFCDTLQEIEGKLDAGLAGQGPVFAHTRSLNLHISKLTRGQRAGSPDPADGGFQVPAATAVRRMDACFGGFISYLKKANLFDDSIVILTADHGDSQGESRRWGHTYTLFPEIVRTPLLVHIPSRLRAQFTADVDAASFSTDITPSLYALLGYPIEPHDWPLGRSLFVPPGTDTSWRKREPAVIASSYGPVYGVLRNNGESLYIADGVNKRDYAYDLSALKPVRIGVTAQMRSENRTFIHGEVAALASLYHFTPAH